MLISDRRLLGERIRKLRLAAGLTQEQAAEKVDRSLRFYADVERGGAGMSVDTLLALCALYATTPDTLLLPEPPSPHGAAVRDIVRRLNELDSASQARALKLLALFLGE